MANQTLKPLFIRADAGGFIGTGHVMRMIALAQMWIDDGGWRTVNGERTLDTKPAESRGQVVFICAKLPEGLEVRLKEEGFAVVGIDAVPGSEEDLRQTLEVVDNGEWRMADSEEENPQFAIRHPLSPLSKDSAVPNSWIVVDGYHFDYTYQKGIKERSGLRLLCVDDHGYSDRWYCDAILNQNLDADKRMHYQSELPDTKLLLGAPFCLLRREFLQAPRPNKEWGSIQKLLVTLGGSDPDNATSAVLELLNQSCRRALDIRVLLGADNLHAEKIQSLSTHHRFEILRGVSNMPEQYAWADGIISAGGSTCWEWLYFGLPGAIVTIADNQLPIVKALSKTRRAALSLGWFCKCDQNAKLKSVRAWLDSPASIIDQTEACSMINGMGSLRVASFLMGKDEYCPWRSPVDSMS